MGLGALGLARKGGWDQPMQCLLWKLTSPQKSHADQVTKFCLCDVYSKRAVTVCCDSATWVFKKYLFKAVFAPCSLCIQALDHPFFLHTCPFFFFLLLACITMILEIRTWMFSPNITVFNGIVTPT